RQRAARRVAGYRHRHRPGAAARAVRRRLSFSPRSAGRSSLGRAPRPSQSTAHRRGDDNMASIGFIGASGLMGHGMAKNLLAKGHALRFTVHRNRERVADLLGAGALEAATPAALASKCEIVFLCVTGPPQVEAAIGGADGLLAGAKDGRGLAIVDCSTSEPDSTAKLRAACAAAGATLVELVSAGAVNSGLFQAMAKTLNGDLAGLKFELDNARKDIRYYTHLAEGLAVPCIVGEAVHQSLVLASALGHGKKFVPSLVEAQEQL